LAKLNTIIATEKEGQSPKARTRLAQNRTDILQTTPKEEQSHAQLDWQPKWFATEKEQR